MEKWTFLVIAWEGMKLYVMIEWETGLSTFL
jgi:hypothetical protein